MGQPFRVDHRIASAMLDPLAPRRRLRRLRVAARRVPAVASLPARARCVKTRARPRRVTAPRLVLKDVSHVMSFRTRPAGAEPGLQPTGHAQGVGCGYQSGGPGTRTPKRSRAAVFKFVGVCCVSLRMVGISLRYTGLPGKASCIELRAFACFCAPVLPTLLPFMGGSAGSGGGNAEEGAPRPPRAVTHGSF